MRHYCIFRYSQGKTNTCCISSISHQTGIGEKFLFLANGSKRVHKANVLVFYNTMLFLDRQS